LTPNERRVAEDRRDCYWLYVVTHCKTTPRLEASVRDPARLNWKEITKVEHYCLAAEALLPPPNDLRSGKEPSCD
ncbi:MAG: protein NO VEIN domain-containing protein, partial [Phycisphaerae bacterium]